MNDNQATDNTSTNGAENELVITRTFNAPCELVFKACTDVEHLKHWWIPKGWTIHVAEFDLRPGGVFHYSMQSAEGVIWVKFVYQEIVEPGKLVFVSSFSDEEGNIVRAPFWSGWPLELLIVWTLSEEDGKTTLAMRGIPVNASEEELQFFLSVRPDAEQGYDGTFDQLAEYLAKV